VEDFDAADYDASRTLPPRRLPEAVGMQTVPSLNITYTEVTSHTHFLSVYHTHTHAHTRPPFSFFCGVSVCVMVGGGGSHEVWSALYPVQKGRRSVHVLGVLLLSQWSATAVTGPSVDEGGPPWRERGRERERERERERDYICSSHLGLIRWRHMEVAELNVEV